MHKHVLCERHQNVYKDQQLKYSADRQQEHVWCETVYKSRVTAAGHSLDIVGVKS